KLLGTLTGKEIKKLILGGVEIDSEIEKIINQKAVTAKTDTNQENLIGLFELGLEQIPIIDETGTIKDIAFCPSIVNMKKFPTVRGRAPLRISFSGGGTDLPYFFEKYGGIVLSAAIDKYCYATITKRADRKVVIDSDLTSETDVSVNSLENLKYDGKFDLIKAVIKLMNPDFGFELFLHNDVPPGRGLGSSASAAVMVISLLNHLQETNYDSYKIAELAFKAEREELKIKGGWQDQYAAVTGGFNFMEFNGDKTIIYPLRLKDEVINELNHHLLLCYVGKGHESGEIHKVQEENFIKKQEDSVLLLNSMKKIAAEMKDALLTNKLDIFGKLLHDSWENKKILSPAVTNNFIDKLYEVGLNNGADGGKLLGAGSGGYLLFFFNPKKRNQLTRALQKSGGEFMNFGFDLRGAQVWTVKNRI
ncbi:hypothetical protein HYW75_01190, partial [Candidatus Pacearchaeota archaeon]|nr:hypothetical protein [Candidatus Pacearchaeota archaeon]